MPIWKSLLATAAFVLVSSQAAFSQPYEDKLLFRKGAWGVTLTHNVTEGNIWCAAETTNRRGQKFSITAYPQNLLVLYIFDGSWDIAKRPIKFLVDIDYSRWIVDGQGDGISISVTMNEPDSAIKFLSELMRGNAVALMNTDRKRLATFSLSGSSAAINTLFECWNAIAVDKDPFSTGSDPFGASTDPFN